MNEPSEKTPGFRETAIHPAFKAWEDELSTRSERLSAKVNATVVLYLEKLAERYGLSKVATIEKLVLEAHDLHYYCGDDDGRFMKGKCDCQFLKKYEERRG